MSQKDVGYVGFLTIFCIYKKLLFNSKFFMGLEKYLYKKC
jgi:hypothetical protein